MFETLKGKLQTVFDGLAKRGALAEADGDSAWREVPRAFYRILPLVHHYALGYASTVSRAEHFRDHAGCPVVKFGFKER